MLPILEACAVALASISLLSAKPACSPTSPALARVEFAWQLEGVRAGAPLVLELGVRNDFAPDPRLHAIELPPGTTEHVFEGRLLSNTIYHWRVRTAGEGEPVESGTASFESKACAVGDQMGS